MGRGYDPDMDYRQKISDLRKDWEKMAQARRLVAERERGVRGYGFGVGVRIGDDAGGYDDYDDGEEWDDDLSTEVSSYFEKTTGGGKKTTDEGGKGEKISGGSSCGE